MDSRGAAKTESAQSESDRFWSQKGDTLLSKLGSSADGLSQAEATRRLSQYGHNALVTKTEITPFGLFLGQFKNPIMLILIFATIASALLGDVADALIITLIVLGSAALSFFQEYSAGQAAGKLKEQIQAKATVVRDGQPRTIPVDEVVPGDIVKLQAGSLIPADGVLLQTNDLFVNQAVLTGETFPVEKDTNPSPEDAQPGERTNAVFLGTSVRSGTGNALIVETGKTTAFGQIAERLRLRPPETEFERGIRQLGYLLTQVMFVLVITVFAVNVLRGNPAIDSLLFSVALAVGLTPQLLPAIININLSRGSQKMAQEGVIVRRLSAIENFGSMDVLCTDKTGTLTEGVIKLNSANGLDGNTSDGVLRLAYLNAALETGMDDALDDAIRNFKKLDISQVKKIAEIPYDFGRKRLTIVVKEGSVCTMISKGALDNIVRQCDLRSNREERHAIMAKYTGWSQEGYRVLGVATKEVSEKATYSDDDEAGLTFKGFLLFFDPPKTDVKEVLADLSKLGVELKVITGDNKLVAKHMAE